MLSHTRRILLNPKNNYRYVTSALNLRFPHKEGGPYDQRYEGMSFGQGNDELTYNRGELKRKEDVLPYVNSLERFMDRIHFDRWDFSIAGIKHYSKRKKQRQEVHDQTYNPQRVGILGPNLSAATFFVYRGAAVKFVGKNSMCTFKERNTLPNSRDPAFLIEALDLTGLEFHYEALEHLKELEHLKCLSFKGSSMFSNWYLDRLTAVAPELEYLDISYCKNVDTNGLHCLYRMKNLKCLNVEGISDSLEFRLSCLTIESERPDFVILGIIQKPKAKTAFDTD